MILIIRVNHDLFIGVEKYLLINGSAINKERLYRSVVNSSTTLICFLRLLLLFLYFFIIIIIIIKLLVALLFDYWDPRSPKPLYIFSSVHLFLVFCEITAKSVLIQLLNYTRWRKTNKQKEKKNANNNERMSDVVFTIPLRGWRTENGLFFFFLLVRIFLFLLCSSIFF